MKKQKPKLKPRSFTANDYEWECIEACATANDITKAQWIRRVVRLELASLGYFRGNLKKKKAS